MSIFYEFESVDTFTTGAVGRPGARVFYLQARQGRQRVAVKCEKQQVAAIAQYLEQVLKDLPPPDDKPAGALDLVEPVEQTFVLGRIGLGYDRSSGRLIVQLEEMGDLDDEIDDDDEDEDEPDDLDDLDDLDERGHDGGADREQGEGGQVRLYVSRGQAVAFCEQAAEVIAAGRPDCRWCGRPIDPDGHACARMN